MGPSQEKFHGRGLKGVRNIPRRSLKLRYEISPVRGEIGQCPNPEPSVNSLAKDNVSRQLLAQLRNRFHSRQTWESAKFHFLFDFGRVSPAMKLRGARMTAHTVKSARQLKSIRIFCEANGNGESVPSQMLTISFHKSRKAARCA